MARKEKIEVRRDNDFNEMDSLLSDALADLEASNQRVEQILSGGDDESAESGLDAETEASTAETTDEDTASSDADQSSEDQ